MDVYATQKARNLHYIFPEHFELQLFKAFNPLKLLGCDYFYFLGLESGLSYRFCTDENWMDIYHDEKFIADDPLKRVIENTNFIVLPWEQVTHLHGKEKRTMYGRVSFGLYNGLTIAREHSNKKYIFALATESKEHDLARFLLLEKSKVLEQFVFECIKLFNQYLSLTLNPVYLMM